MKINRILDNEKINFLDQRQNNFKSKHTENNMKFKYTSFQKKIYKNKTFNSFFKGKGQKKKLSNQFSLKQHTK